MITYFPVSWYLKSNLHQVYLHSAYLSTILLLKLHIIYHLSVCHFVVRGYASYHIAVVNKYNTQMTNANVSKHPNMTKLELYNEK